MKKKYLYLCNMERECKNSTNCGRNCMNGCFHTSDESFAKNKPEDRIFNTDVYQDENNEMVITHWEEGAKVW